MTWSTEDPLPCFVEEERDCICVVSPLWFWTQPTGVDSVLAQLQELKVSLNYSQEDIDEWEEHLKVPGSESNVKAKQVDELKSDWTLMGYRKQVD